VLAAVAGNLRQWDLYFSYYRVVPV